MVAVTVHHGAQGVPQTLGRGILTEEIVLANNTVSPRENRLRVQTRWRGPGTLYGLAKEIESPFTAQSIERLLAVEFMEAAPDLEPMQRHNRLGPYLYVQTQAGDSDTCIYAWRSLRSRRAWAITLTQSITTAAVAPSTHTAMGAKNAICSSEYLVTAAPTSQIASTATTIPATSFLLPTPRG